MEKEKREIAILLKNVNKTFHLSDKADFKHKLLGVFGKYGTRDLKALVDINLEISKGERFGIIGANGSGKTTLTKIMSGAFVSDKGGVVERNGSSLLMNLGVGMSHELTARENIFVSGSALGMRIKDIESIFDEIVKFAELEEFVNTKIKHYSSGMIQRLSFSIAVNAGADIIFLDEVFAVGDEKFRRKAIKVFEQAWLEGRTVVMVSHSLGNIQKYCDRAIYLKKGKTVFIGDAKEAVRLYQEDNK